MGENRDGPDATTPFTTKFTILKFNSDNKKIGKPAKLHSKKKAKVNIFKKYQEQN